MARYDSADLLARCKRLANRPTTDALMADADWYAFLSEGQEVLVGMIASAVPEAMLTVPTKLVSADGGYTYPFASSQYPLGVSVYGSLKDIPWSPLVLGSDYTWEGDLLRMTGGRSQTFADGPYAQYVPEVGASVTIDASNPPIVFPLAARRWLIPYALEQFSYRAKQDPTPWLTKQALVWDGNPASPSDVGVQGQLKLAVQRRGRAEAQPWWRSADLG